MFIFLYGQKGSGIPPDNFECLNVKWNLKLNFKTNFKTSIGNLRKLCESSIFVSCVNHQKTSNVKN